MAFAVAAFVAVGVPRADAEITADVLVSADLRGIRSHGAGRLPYFLSKLRSGVINTAPAPKFSQNSDTTGLLDADRALGTVAADSAMRRAMTMANAHGSGFVAVTNSTHFGYAGYWADMAQRSGFIGIAMSNGSGRTAPTFALEGILGTNPLSVTVPGGEGATDFYLDMATSTVALGKIETAVREGRPISPGWLPAGAGPPRLDERGKLEADYPVLPLGGEGEELGGHKGYGLSLLVEVLSGALGGSPLPGRLDGSDEETSPSVGHFVGAIKLSGFRDAEEIGADMAATFDVIRSARRDPRHPRIYIHGELETEAERENRVLGVGIPEDLLWQLRQWNTELDLRAAWL